MKLAFNTPDPNFHIWETLCCLICLMLSLVCAECNIIHHSPPALAFYLWKQWRVPILLRISNPELALQLLPSCSPQETGRGLCWVGRAIAAGSSVSFGIGKEWPLLCNSLPAITTSGKEWFIEVLSVQATARIISRFCTSFCNRNVWAMSVLDPLTILHNCFSIFNKFCWQTALRQQHNPICNPDE